MSIPIEVLEALRDAGCTADQIVAAIRADHERLLARKLYRAVKRAIIVPDAPAAEKGDSDVPVSVGSGDRLGRKHIARKALVAAPGLSPQTKMIIGALVDRANVDTGYCNPSRRRIAQDARIGGVNPERAVLRGIVEAQRDGLLSRRPGAGRGHSTVYTVHWEKFGELFDQMEGRAPATMWAAMGRLKRDNDARRNGDNGDDNVPLTHKDSKPSGLVDSHSAQTPTRQLELRVFGSVAGDAGPAAERRVIGDIEREAKRQPSFNVSGLTKADWADVYAAERHQRGRGIEVIRERLATGPPKTAAGGG